MMTGVRHASIDPDGQGSLGRILIARLEEPEEDVLVLGDIEITRETLDAGIGLANAGGDLFVADGDVEIPLGGNEIRGWRHKLGPGDGQSSHQGSSPESVHVGQQRSKMGKEILKVKIFRACSSPFYQESLLSLIGKERSVE